MNAFEVIGVLGVIYFGFRLTLQACHCIYVYVIKAPKTRDCIRRQKGRWAVVTGATDGIGKAYAGALAKKGLNIVLVSRNPKKLNDCAAELVDRYSVETKVISVDFTQGDEIFKTIEAGIANLEIGVLVNNVGMSYEYPELYLDVPERTQTITALIRVNIMSVVRMCEIVMPNMVDRRSGVVINISSLSALIPAPYLCVYSGTKAFVGKFTDDLRTEYEDKGLVIQAVYPGYVVSNMSKLRKSTWLAPTADTFVASALSTVGVNDNTTGYFSHTLMHKLVGAMEYLCNPLAKNMIYKNLQAIRLKALKHKAKVQDS